MFAGSEVDRLNAAGALDVTATSGSPVETLLRGLQARGTVRHFEMRYKQAHIAWRRRGNAH